MNTNVLRKFSKLVKTKEFSKVTYEEDQNSYTSFKENKPPYVAGISVYSRDLNDESESQSQLLPYLGDPKLKLQSGGPKWHKEIHKELKLSEKTELKVEVDIPTSEVRTRLIKAGFKKKGNQFEYPINDPKDSIKIITEFIKSLGNRLN